MKSTPVLTSLLFLSLVACNRADDATAGKDTQPETAASEWPKVESPIRKETATEARIAAIIDGMTLEQKIGQMTQPDIRYITPDEVRTYYIGSILNGGGAWPDMNKQATAKDWAALSNAYYTASMSTDMKVQIPVIWGTDAVHGHNNVMGATVFPHNIGLGAAHDPELVGEIGRATAKAARATGITWVFAPTVAVAQNMRWGRTYESFSSDPALVAAYAGAYVHGLQGELTGDGDVVATAKHYLGDGGTFDGIDQGENRARLATLISVHGAGYYSALNAGVQTVMASYSSWTDGATGTPYGKMHGNRYLLTDVLKGKLGFDGLLVSDWNAIEQVPGCTIDHCPASINAGIDMVMVPTDWKNFIANTVTDVREGRIGMDRINDAVARILRVKLRSGLFDKAPSASAFDGSDAALKATELGRRAVRESAVLLKNNGGVLPLADDKPVLIVGKAADDMSRQTGGWTLTWQGTENTNADFTTGETFLAAARAALGKDRVVYSADGEGVDPSQFSAVIAVVGELPYAEKAGDLRFPVSLQYSAHYPEDLAVLEKVSGKGVPVVTVLYSGRTLYTNDLINLSDAFVAAFLPGTEAEGLADLLFRTPDGSVAHDFRGRLSFSWPGNACAAGDGPASDALFPVGYGLSYHAAAPLATLPVTPVESCGTPRP